MRKEVLIAIILGFGLGLVITFGIWSANQALRKKAETQPAAPLTTPAPTIPALSLAILSPEDESVQEKDKITVSGTTEPEAQVVVVGEKDEKITQADQTGKFEAEITLEAGTNVITVTVLTDTNDEVTKTLNVVYSTASFLAITPAGAEKPATSSAKEDRRIEEIKQRVEERIQEIKDKIQKKAIWGNIKQITNSTLILETPSGERWVKTTVDTKVFLDKKGANLVDLAIGQFLIVTGSPEKNETILAARISAFTKEPKFAPRRQVIAGKVTDVSSEEKILIVTNQKRGVSFQIKATGITLMTKKIDDKVQKVNFEAIAIGDRAVVVANKDKTGAGFTAKIIHIIPGKATGLEQKATPIP